MHSILRVFFVDKAYRTREGHPPAKERESKQAQRNEAVSPNGGIQASNEG